MLATLFSPKKPSTPLMIRQESSRPENENGDALSKILSLPMPKILSDVEYDSMDVFTAASLSSEVIQRYIGNVKNNQANAVNAAGWTPLMYAAYLGHKEISQLLLSQGANPEACNEDGQTAIMLAASCGSVDVINVLIKHNAKANHQDKFGRSSLHYAIKYNQTKITEILLIQRADPNLPDFESMTPTLMACQVGNEATVALLLKYKGNPNLRNKRGEQGISLALEHPKVLQLLKPEKTDKTAGVLNSSMPVAELLRQLDLEKYLPNFQIRRINTVQQLSKLLEKDLNDIGITAIGPKKKLLNVICQYKEAGRVNLLADNEAASTQPSSNGSSCDNRDGQTNSNTPTSMANGDTHVNKLETSLLESQKQLRQLNNLCMAQQREMRAQQDLNTQVRRLLSQVANKQCPNCNSLTSSVNATIERLDQMSMSLGAFLTQSRKSNE
ncbi:ankyrin repeats (3 copies) domain-containing protein [Ditylenchus destructor]|uniref:Ankyrin repeats (3 copies) domain-containing protein n=1 Tax=Ditylenchus destructor TaxID=166010 RepID=A0AAD4N3T6_9BILA|nr:ankyrin repeats (3 copies) domain-containing protein [Ditylenchus destructor]